MHSIQKVHGVPNYQLVQSIIVRGIRLLVEAVIHTICLKRRMFLIILLVYQRLRPFLQLRIPTSFRNDASFSVALIFPHPMFHIKFVSTLHLPINETVIVYRFQFMWKLLFARSMGH